MRAPAPHPDPQPAAPIAEAAKSARRWRTRSNCPRDRGARAIVHLNDDAFAPRHPPTYHLAELRPLEQRTSWPSYCQWRTQRNPKTWATLLEGSMM